MKLLLFSSYFPTSVQWARGMFNLQQALAVAERCELRVAAPQQWFPVRLWHGAGPVDEPWRTTVKGLPTWYPRYALTPRVARDTYALQMAAAVLPQLARIRREYPFEVIWATWAFPDVVVAAMAARLWNVPLVAKVHGSDINVTTEFPLRRRQIRWAMDRAHRVLAVSGALRERLVEIGVPGERIMVHHNGVDRDRFRPADRVEARSALGIRPEGRHVVYVGFLNPAKAVHDLLQALAQLRDAGRLDFTTHLVGTGPLEQELHALAASLGLQEHAIFYGARPHDQIPLWMQAADVFCLPSVREGCPNVILESLSTGRPVVSTRVGGIPELVTGDNAILVPPSSPDQLAAALREALDRDWDPEALRASVARFSWDESARAIHDAAREALELHGEARRSPPVEPLAASPSPSGMERGGRRPG